jgi:hypothetical protein
MAPLYQALGLRRTLLVPKREAGRLQHGQPKTAYSPHFLPIPGLAARYHIKMLNRPLESR